MCVVFTSAIFGILYSPLSKDEYTLLCVTSLLYSGYILGEFRASLAYSLACIHFPPKIAPMHIHQKLHEPFYYQEMRPGMVWFGLVKLV